MLDHTKAAKKFYNSKAWLQCRQSYISKVFGLCEKCDDPGYILDHIVELNSANLDDADITLNHDNLQYLCTPCHNVKTFRKSEPLREGFSFDNDGNLFQKNKNKNKKD